MEERKILILLNDKDPVFARVAGMKIKKEAGWDTVITTSFEQALTSVKEFMPDLLLTEIIINDSTGKTGFDLVNEVNQLDKNNKAVIAVLSDLSQPEDRQKAKNMGADFYFVKSEHSIIDLIEILKKIVSGEVKVT